MRSCRNKLWKTNTTLSIRFILNFITDVTEKAQFEKVDYHDVQDLKRALQRMSETCQRMWIPMGTLSEYGNPDVDNGIIESFQRINLICMRCAVLLIYHVEGLSY